MTSSRTSTRIAVGEGWRQTGRETPPLPKPYADTFLHWSNGGGTILEVGDKQLNLRTAADAATALAGVVERVRARHLVRVEKEANAAMARRYGMPPES